MHLRPLLSAAVLMSLLLLTPSSLSSQETANSSADKAVSIPQLIRFSGDIKIDQSNEHLLGMTFALFREQHGGAPLWLETQNVRVDPQGHYTVLLGSQTKGGVPFEVFATNEARWLGVTPENGEELPRVLLVSVPYALKAQDTATLNGHPASDFVLAGSSTGATNAVSGATTQAESAPVANANVIVAGAAAIPQNYILKGDGAGGMMPSVAYDDGTNLGIGTISPTSKLDVQTTSSTPVVALNTSTTLTNGSANASKIVNAMNLTISDKSTASNLSKQTMRLNYVREATATGGVDVYDTMFTATPAINSDAPYTLIGLNMEAPNVASGKTLNTFYGAVIGAGTQSGGTVTNRYSLVTTPGAGNVGFNTTAPIAPLNLVADNPSGTDRATQFVMQGKTNTNLKLNIGIHTEASTPFADFSFLEEGAAWRNLVLAKNGGSVGIGTTTPGSKLSVAGTIESTSGGIKFPDGTIQATAVAGSGGAAVSNVMATGGSGLLASPTTGNVTLNTDFAVLQKRVGASCTAGNAIRVVASDGTVTCEPIPAQSIGVPTGFSVMGNSPFAPTGFNSTGNWMAMNGLAIWDSTLAKMLTFINGFGYAMFNGDIYTFGGNGNLTTVYQYDTSANSWAVKAPMTTGRYLATAVTYGNYIYVFGGQGGTGFLSSCEKYDPTNNVWLTGSSGCSSMPVANAAYCMTGAAVESGTSTGIYLFGGWNGNYSTQVLRYNVSNGTYDTNTNTSNALASLPSGRCAAAATYAAGKIFVTGGNNNSGVQNNNWAYDPVANTFTSKANMPVARNVHTATLSAGGLIYIAGGNIAEKSLIIYDPSTDSYATAPALPNNRSYHGAGFLNANTLMLFGGTFTGNDTSDVFHADRVTYLFQKN